MKTLSFISQDNWSNDIKCIAIKDSNHQFEKKGKPAEIEKKTSQNRSMLKSKGHACAVTRIDGKAVIVVSGGYKDLGELNGNLLDSVELMYEGKDFFMRGKNSLIFKLSYFLRMIVQKKPILFSKA